MSKTRNLAVRYGVRGPGHWCFVGLAAITTLLGACDSADSDATTVGTETNWLTRCEDSEECSVGSCVCGLCTFECEGAADCAQAPGPSRCAASADADYDARCGGSVPGICLEEATTEPTSSATEDSLTGTSAEDATADTASDTVGVGSTVSSTTDGAGNSASIDTEETEGTSNGTVSQGGATDGTTGGANSSLETSAGGAGNTLGNAGSGGSLGNGGSGSSSLCPAGCDEVCEGDVCGCSCSPDWSACEMPSECAVTALDCCACGTLDAVNTNFFAEATCSQSGEECAPCATAQDPYSVASCINNRCALVQLDETPLTECTEDQDCYLAEPSCCSSCNPAVDPLGLIALNDEFNLSGLLCAEGQGCDACVTPFPEDYTAVCNAGRCAVEQTTTADECPAPAGTPLSVETYGSIDCFGPSSSGLAIEPTLITSAAELEEIITRCESFNASPVPSVDFETRVLFAAVVSQRPTITLAYAVQTEGDIRIGIDAPAYCGGAFPGDGLIFIEMNTPALPVVQDTCFTGMCSGPPVP